mgnify:CR=1 FL=1
MSFVLAVGYGLVSVGVYLGRRSDGCSVLVALGVSLIWPVLLLVGFGSRIG